jgi:outer membrane protein assembly factor BamB
MGSTTYSTPAIGIDGTVYFVTEYGKLFAISPPTSGSEGILKWSYSINTTTYSSPAISSDGTIYVGTYTNTLYAFTASGALKWTCGIPTNIFYSSPAIGSDGTVYVGANDGTGTGADTMFAITAPTSGTTGIIKWSYRIDSGTFSSPAIGPDGTIYIILNNGKLYALK